MNNRKLSIDLNGDVGEGAPTDREFIPLLTSVNIACGVHAGDDRTMVESIEYALAAGVQIGAHPGFPDREHFGRREMSVNADEVFNIVTEQLTRFTSLVSRHEAMMQHVKPHGALYHQVSRDPALAEALVRAVASIDRRAAIVGAGNSALEQLAHRAQLRFVTEAFADRVYGTDGRLLSRSDARSLISDADQVSRQALQIICEGSVTTVDGTGFDLPAETICLHGDSAEAIGFARRLRADLRDAGIHIRSFGAS
jgi:UPF0271 protein